ncbi:hypothetical protein HK102_001691 [Quaeritorhiza haematococci]|nr:hypothetical protein HK102_001691 [Quaeritorhiza haematococci]
METLKSSANVVSGSPAHSKKLCAELWERIFVFLDDPQNLTMTAKSFHAMGKSAAVRAWWLRRRYHSLAQLFGGKEFEVLDLLQFEAPVLVQPRQTVGAVSNGAGVGGEMSSLVGLSASSGHPLSSSRSKYPRLMRLVTDEEVVLKLPVSRPDGSGAHTPVSRSTPSVKTQRQALRRLLRFLCYFGHTKAITALLAANEKLATSRREMGVATAYAVSNGQDSVVRYLLEHHRPALERHGDLAVCEAVRTNNIGMLDLLMEEFYQQHPRVDAKFAALNNAMAWCNNAGTLDHLVKKGASILYFDWDYFCSQAVKRRQHSKAGRLGEQERVPGSLQQIDIAKDHQAGTVGILSELCEVLDRHLTSGRVDVDDFHEEALIYAAEYGDLNFLNYLRERGADLAEGGGEDALYVATCAGQLGSTEWLVQEGVDIHFDHDAPLRAAVGNNHLPVVKYLVSQGANVRAHEDEALRVAAERGFTGVVAVLLESGAEHINLALKQSAAKGHVKTSELLLEKGNADICASLGVQPAVMQLFCQMWSTANQGEVQGAPGTENNAFVVAGVDRETKDVGVQTASEPLRATVHTRRENANSWTSFRVFSRC